MTTLKQQCINEDIQFTTNILEAIYILPDGTMIDGCFYDGDRTEDHRLLELISQYDRYDGNLFWLDILETKNILMIIPETKTILYKNKKLTKETVILLNQLVHLHDYEIMEYK